MSAIDANELHEGRDSQKTLDERGQLTRTYTRVWQVFTDDMLTAQIEVEEADGIPVLWAVYQAESEADLGARVISKTTKQDDENPFRWTVELKYSSRWQDAAKAVTNPLLRPYEITWDTADFQEAIEDDEDGEALVNSSFEPVDPPITRDAARQTFTITKNMSFYDGPLFAEYLNPCAINDAPFFGFEEAQVKIKKISAGKEQHEDEVAFIPVTFVFETVRGYWDEGRTDPKTWDLWYLDQGYSEIDPDTLVQKPILEGAQVVSTPRLLNGSGQQWDGVTPVFLGPKKIYPRKDFSALGIS